MQGFLEYAFSHHTPESVVRSHREHGGATCCVTSPSKLKKSSHSTPTTLSSFMLDLMGLVQHLRVSGRQSFPQRRYVRESSSFVNQLSLTFKKYQVIIGMPIRRQDFGASRVLAESRNPDVLRTAGEDVQDKQQVRNRSRSCDTREKKKILRSSSLRRAPGTACEGNESGGSRRCVGPNCTLSRSGLKLSSPQLQRCLYLFLKNPSVTFK